MKAKEILRNKKVKIDNENLMYLLRYLFVLEYRFGDKIWYDVHPCLKEFLEKKGK